VLEDIGIYEPSDATMLLVQGALTTSISNALESVSVPLFHFGSSSSGTNGIGGRSSSGRSGEPFERREGSVFYFSLRESESKW